MKSPRRGSLGLTLSDADGTMSGSSLKASKGVSEEFHLGAGTYTLTETNTGTSPADATISLHRKQALFAVLLDGGVSQGAALNLRLVTPAPSFGQESGAPARDRPR